MPDDPWVIDTRTTDHMTGNLGNLHSLIPYHDTDGVMVGNGETLPITNIDIGQATVGTSDSSIILNDVLLVPMCDPSLY